MRVFTTIATILILAVSASAERTGVYSFEQECSTGYCPNTAGPASCFTVGYDARGGTCVITAKHCTAQTANRFYVVNDSGQRMPAVVVWRSPSLDIAVLRVAKKLSRVAVRFDTPPPKTGVRLKGVLTRRYQESRGVVKLQEPNGRIWFSGLWSHSGMSGGALTDLDGLIFGVHHSSVVGSNDTIGVGIRPAVEQYERRYGRLDLAKGSIRLQQSQPPYNQNTARRCGDGRHVDCVPVQIPIPRPQIDYEQAAAEVFRRYGEQLRGRDGTNGQSANLDVDKLADLITTRYADRLRGTAGEVDYERFAALFFQRYGEQLRGRDGENGNDGERGFVGVPSSQDIRNWLVGASSDPETRAMLATTFADIVSNDPRVEQLIQRLEQLEIELEQRGELPVPVATEIARKFATVDSKFKELENRVVPVVVRNADGSVFSSDPDRKAFDEIGIRLLPPDRN